MHFKRRGGFLDKIPLIGPLFKAFMGGGLGYGGGKPYGGGPGYGGGYGGSNKIGRMPSTYIGSEYKKEKEKPPRGTAAAYGTSPPLTKHRPLEISSNIQKIAGSGRKKRKGGFLGALLGSLLPTVLGHLSDGSGMRNKRRGCGRKTKRLHRK
jgi:hypothetical protein